MQRLSLSHSIRACRKLTALAHSSFAPAFALLPAHKRQAMEILYAYTRFTDDLVDLPDFDPQTGQEIPVNVRRKKQKLNQWTAALESVLGQIGSEEQPDIDPHDETAFQKIAESFPGCGGLVFLPALKMIVDRFHIPREPLFHLIDGVETDIEPKPFASFDDSIDYCHQVATSVGFASLAVWGTTEPLFSESVVRAAKACGIAFQWTNILRDMLEDYNGGRIYLPQAELQRAGLTDKQFGSLLNRKEWNKQKIRQKGGDSYAHQQMIQEMEKFENKFAALITNQLRRCEVYYANSEPLYRLIHRDSRRMFGLMWNSYYSIYQKMCRKPALLTSGNRIRLSSGKKFRLWLHWRLMPCFRLR
ncbi:MAG: squalene/phytoene synthase family protein [Planctomycetaceae bacterium]|nr:squalene/phytoene synthase family protein [Planctomycetaceae bacterium]